MIQSVWKNLTGLQKAAEHLWCDPETHKIYKRILHKINKNVRLLKSMFISMYSILGWGSFCMNYCLNAAWRGGDQSVALLRCNEAQVSLIAAFRSSAGVGSDVSHLPLDNTPQILYEVQVWWVCWPVKHSNTMVIEPVFGTFGSVGRCQVLLENEICISIKLVSRRKHEVL